MREKLLTRKEAAQYLGLTPKTLAVWHLSGRLRGIKLGNSQTSRVMYPQALLDAFLARLAAEQGVELPRGEHGSES